MTRGKPLSFDRAEVLIRAMELFWAKGYNATGMTELLDYMGIQRQSFYNAFDSKHQVLVEAVELYKTMLIDGLRTSLGRKVPPLQRLEGVFDLWTKLIDEHASWGCLVGNCAAEFGTREGEIGGIVRRGFEEIETMLAAVFQEAMDAGDLPADQDAHGMARTMVTLGQGLTLMAKTGVPKESLYEVMEVARNRLFR